MVLFLEFDIYDKERYFYPKIRYIISLYIHKKSRYIIDEFNGQTYPISEMEAAKLQEIFINNDDIDYYESAIDTYLIDFNRNIFCNL